MKKDYITNPVLFGKPEIIGFGSKDFYIKELGKVKSNELIISNHYAKKVAGFATTYIYLGIYINTELIGTLQYGFAMNAASMDKVVSDTTIHEYLELNRMWLHDKAIRNSESKAISYSIKYIRGKFPKIKWIQSFADERCGGFGIVYQASNFSYFGEHKALFWMLNDEWFHNIGMTNKTDKNYNLLQKNKDIAEQIELRQFRYIFFIDKRWKKKCLLKEMPYPKHYKEN